MNRFIKVLQGESVDRPPIWMMRQAGRYLPEFKQERAKNPDFMSFCHDIESVVRVTLQPFKRFNLDAAIIFSDILTIPHAMGHNVRFVKGIGPILDSPLQPNQSLLKLQSADLQFVMKGIEATRSAMDHQALSHIPLLGFSATPWTLLCYLMAGSGSKEGFTQAIDALNNHHQWVNTIAIELNQIITDYVLQQIDAGANAIMLFDSWAQLVPRSHYESIFIPCHEKLIANIRRHTDAPVILFAREANVSIPCLIDTGAHGYSIGLDHHIPTLCQQFPQVTWQGNLCPDLLADGSMVDIDLAIQKMLPQQPARFIANLAHGIRPHTPIENVQHWVNQITQ